MTSLTSLISVRSLRTDSLLAYLGAVAELPDREQPRFLGERKLSELFVAPTCFARLQNAESVVLDGRCGYGKTTLLQMLARQVAIESIVCIEEKTKSIEEVAVPFLIDFEALEKLEIVEAAASRAMERSALSPGAGSKQRFTQDHILRHLRGIVATKQAVLLLDGLERVSQVARAAIRDRLADYLVTPCRIVVATRQEARDDWLLPDRKWEAIHLQESSKDFRERLKARWSPVEPKPPPEIPAEAVSPLLLTFALGIKVPITNAHNPEIEYAEAVVRQFALGTWTAKPLLESNTLAQATLATLPLTVWILARNRGLRHSYTYDEICQALSEVVRLKPVDHSFKAIREHLEAVGFLVNRRLEDWSFPHAFLQEYLAAKGACASSRDIYEILEHVHEPLWWNVLVNVSALVFASNPDQEHLPLDQSAVARLAAHVARIESLRGHHDAAAKMMQAALMYSRHSDFGTKSLVQHEAGSLALYRKELGLAAKRYSSALFLNVLSDSKAGSETAANLMALATVLRERRVYRFGRVLLWAAIAFARNAKDRRHQASSWRLLGGICLDVAALDDADKAVVRGLEVCVPEEDLDLERVRLMLVLNWVTYYKWVFSGATMPTAPVDLFSKCESEARVVQSRYLIADALLGRLWFAIATGHPAEAEAHSARLAGFVDPGWYPWLESGMLVGRAAIAHSLGDLEAGLVLYRDARRRCLASTETGWAADAAVGEGTMLLRMGDGGEAQRTWWQAVALAQHCTPLRKKVVKLAVQCYTSDPLRAPF